MPESTPTFHRLYTPGGPVQLDKSLYVERQADRDILKHLRQGEYVYILSTRQVGKTSLIKRAARELQAEGVLSVNIDLNQLGTVTTAEQWYLGIITRVARKLLSEDEVVDWWNANTQLNVTDRFSRFFDEVLLERRTERVVIFIDEIDTTFKLEFSDDFFAAIRAMLTQRGEAPALERLSFALIGVANKNDLIADAQRTPFNIAQSVELTDFTFDEALPLAEGFGQSEADARRTLGWVLDWTSGHPFLTQRLCHAIAEAGHNHWTESGIADLVQVLFLKEAEKDSNLRAVRDLLLRRAPDQEAVLRIYRDVLRNKPVVDEENSPNKLHLKLAGVVRSSERHLLKPRNRVYQRAFNLNWVQEFLPVDWQRQLKVMRYTAAALMVLLPLITVPLSIYAWNRKKDADQQRKIAISREISAYAYSQMANDPDLGYQLGARAFNVAETNQAIEAVRNGLTKSLLQAELKGHSGTVSSAQFSPDGKSVVTASYDKAARVWEAASGKTIATLQGHAAQVLSAQFSPDGKWVVTASDDKTARVWEAASGKTIATLQGHADTVRSAQFSPDGKSVVTASLDKTAIIYPYEMFAPVEYLIQRVRGRTLRELRPEERIRLSLDPSIK